MDLQSNSYEKISIKETTIKRTVVRWTLSCAKWTFFLKIITIKWTQVQEQFSRKKKYTFFEKLLFTMFYSWSIFWITFHSVFCPLNCFDWSKKFKIYRNFESVTTTMIHTFCNYGTFYCTDDREEVDETEDETLSFTESLKMLDKIDKCCL